MAQSKTLESVSLEQSLADLFGEFDPPANFAFEPEFRSPIPRPIPDELHEGPYARRQRSVIIGLVVGAVGCLAAAMFPFARSGGQYFLPLIYAGWIGSGLLVLAVVLWLRQALRKGPYRYVEFGTPLVGRVCDQTLRCTTIVNNQPAVYKFALVVQYVEPHTGELVLAQVLSQEIRATEKDKHTTTYRVGDYITLVYLDRVDKKLRAYGFLGLRSGLGVVKRNPEQRGSALTTAIGVAGLFGAGFAFWYIGGEMLRYVPIRWDSAIRLPAAFGAAIFGGGSLWWLRSRHLRKQARMAERNQAALVSGESVEIEHKSAGAFGNRSLALVTIGGLLILGAGLGMGIACAANALLDTSRAQRVPIQITKMITTTHNFVLRDYSIEYRLPNDRNHYTYRSTPEEMAAFPGSSPNAVVREGRFGWPWVEKLEPNLPRR